MKQVKECFKEPKTRADDVYPPWCQPTPDRHRYLPHHRCERACECLPEEEAELKYMQQAREPQTPFITEKYNVLVCCLESFELQVIFQPEPAEHLDYYGWSEHEPNERAEPEEIPMAEKLLREPQIRAHVKHVCTHTDHSEDEIQPRVSREHGGVHGKKKKRQAVKRCFWCYFLSFILPLWNELAQVWAPRGKVWEKSKKNQTDWFRLYQHYSTPRCCFTKHMTRLISNNSAHKP